MANTRIIRKLRPKSPPNQQEVAAPEVLRARSVKRDTDHVALTRRIIARFPKILAALAK
jgi:hypothetical protein